MRVFSLINPISLCCPTHTITMRVVEVGGVVWNGSYHKEGTENS